MKTQKLLLSDLGNYVESFHVIRHHKKLLPFDKLLFEEICTLSKLKGFCYAKNKYLAELYNVSVVTIKRSKSRLHKAYLIYYQNNAIFVNTDEILRLQEKFGINGDTDSSIIGDTEAVSQMIPYNNNINKIINKSWEEDIEKINNNLNIAPHDKNSGITDDTDYDEDIPAEEAIIGDDFADKLEFFGQEELNDSQKNPDYYINKVTEALEFKPGTEYGKK
jgi:hypothetical protein